MKKTVDKSEKVMSGEEKSSAVDHLVHKIRGLISDRNLSIGDALPTERELGEIFSTSRNTVREALQILRAFGMIETRPKVGAVIVGGQGQALKNLFLYHNAITTETFHDLQIFRGYIEVSIGSSVVMTVTTQEIERLRKINSQILNCTNAKDASTADYNFHEALVMLPKNNTSIAVYQMMRPVLEEIMLIGKEIRQTYQSTFDEHNEIINALEARDQIAFSYLMSRHLKTGAQYLGKDISSP